MENRKLSSSDIDLMKLDVMRAQLEVARALLLEPRYFSLAYVMKWLGIEGRPHNRR